MNAKCRLLCLREMFIRYTDQNNYVSMDTIQKYLRSCGYPAHKVTIKETHRKKVCKNAVNYGKI